MRHVSGALTWSSPITRSSSGERRSFRTKGRMVATLNRSHIALFNAHTNGDVAIDGVAQACADAIGLKDTEVLAPEGTNDQGHIIGLGRIGTVSPMSLREFARVVAQALPAGPTGLLVGGDLDATIHRVAVSPGAGDSLLDLVLTSGADVFITADLRHHPASEFLEEGHCGQRRHCGCRYLLAN